MSGGREAFRHAWDKVGVHPIASGARRGRHGACVAKLLSHTAASPTVS
jgi:hypothetical protein